MSSNGSMATADTWITLQGGLVRRSSLGITIEQGSDFLDIVLADGTQFNIFGDGEIWMDSKVININDDDLPWK